MTNDTRTIGFGLSDYWRMLRKRGLRLPINYFLNAHLFDLIRRTDTHTWLPKEHYLEHPPNFESGVFYMTSWTNEIRRSFFILNKLNLLSDPYVFIDIGCGKGKVCLTWQLLEQKYQRKHPQIIGIDYYEPFIKIAKQNFLTVFRTEGKFYLADATSFDFSGLNARLIVYLYNPFDDSIMDRVLKNLPVNTVVIYNNPVHSSTFVENGFEVIYEHLGWHPNAQTIIFTNTKPTSSQL